VLRWTVLIDSSLVGLTVLIEIVALKTILVIILLSRLMKSRRMCLIRNILTILNEISDCCGLKLLDVIMKYRKIISSYGSKNKPNTNLINPKNDPKDGGNSTWGGQVRVFGTVPVCVSVQEMAGGEGRVLAGRVVKGYCGVSYSLGELAILVLGVYLCLQSVLDSGCSKHMTGDRSQLINFVQKFLGMVKFRNDHVVKIMGYSDYKIGNVTISTVYFVEGLGHNLFLASSPICLLSKALKTKSWLWHRRLSHLNFGAINHLARQGLVREAVATACFTQKRSIIRLRHGKTPYELLHNKLPNLSYLYVFDALCYPTNDNFDELTAMASEQSSSGPALNEMTPATISSGLVQKFSSSTPYVPPSRNDWDLLFQLMFDELLNPPPSIDHQAAEVIASITDLQLYEQALFCYYDAFLTSLEPKTYKEALTQSFWIEAMQEELNEFERLEMLIMGKISFFLGLQISQSPRGIFINQSKYALESLKKYGFESCDPMDTPMVEKSKLDEDKEGKAVDPSHYHGMIVTLLYLTASRPDLQLAICMCVGYQARPTEKHVHAIKRIFRYLGGTVHRGLWYPNDSSVALTVFAGADHAGCQDTRRSTSGSVQFLRERLISCVQHSRSKHIDIRYHFIKEQVDNGVIELYFVNTEYQLADLFTKAFRRDRIEFLINKLGMRSFTPETLKQLMDEVDE
nr:hypothetical protein [Tanacetum cinerariifolium]